jgi:hypothetical protein
MRSQNYVFHAKAEALQLRNSFVIVLEGFKLTLLAFTATITTVGMEENS